MNLRKMRKAELHRHLEGALRYSTVVELLKMRGQMLPADLQEAKKMLLVLEPMTDLKSVLDKFWLSQSILQTADIIERITYECCEDAFQEGVNLLELRYSPTFIRQDHEHLSWQQIHDAIVSGVMRAQKTFQMRVGIIGILRRVEPIELVQQTYDFFRQNKKTICAVDLADNEVGFDCRKFESVFKQAKKDGFRITIHAGESRYAESAQQVKDAIDILGAERIGHGIQICNDEKIMEYVAKKGVALEVCPTSNWLTNAVDSLQSHPIRKLQQSGVAVTLNSDDPGIFGIDLTNEYELLAKEYKYTEKEFVQFYEVAKKHTFVS